jgi:hypothetical protein
MMVKPLKRLVKFMTTGFCVISDNLEIHAIQKIEPMQNNELKDKIILFIIKGMENND